ncbi:MAG: MFS transporter [Planctomycetota bacterium]
MSTSPAVRGQAIEEPPPLPLENRSFLSYLATQALGAFNDNVFKQMVLLLSVGYVALADFQAVVQLLFALPFLLFSGFAGDIADRYSKGRIMVLCKVAEIAVMLAGVLAFAWFAGEAGEGTRPPFGLWCLAAVTFLMGTQSSFFGPPKYGGLPELVRRDDLGQAAGLTQMTTFLAIILGVAFAGQLLEWFRGSLWIAGGVAVAIAVLGTLTSLGIARLPAMDPARRLGKRSFLSVFPTLSGIIRNDRLILDVMLVYSFFWLVGGVSLVAINAYGRLQLGLDYAQTSLMVSILSLGIALGSALVARLSRRKVRIGLVVPGMTGMVVCLLALLLVPAHAPTREDIESFVRLGNVAERVLRIIPEAALSIRLAVAAVLLLLGFSAGLMSVPLLAFVQARPARGEKGQVFALANWLNWVFIVGSAGVYAAGSVLCGHRADLVMAGMGLLTLLVGIAFVPRILRRVREERPDFVWMRG